MNYPYIEVEFQYQALDLPVIRIIIPTQTQNEDRAMTMAVKELVTLTKERAGRFEIIGVKRVKRK